MQIENHKEEVPFAHYCERFAALDPQEAAARMKRDGLDNDLLERIAGDSAFPMGHEELTQLLDASAYVGRAPEQAETFILQEVDPILASAQAMAGMGEINV